MRLLKSELRDAASRWNQHYNTGNVLGRCPRGRPDVIYSLSKCVIIYNIVFRLAIKIVYVIRYKTVTTENYNYYNQSFDFTQG